MFQNRKNDDYYLQDTSVQIRYSEVYSWLETINPLQWMIGQKSFANLFPPKYQNWEFWKWRKAFRKKEERRLPWESATKKELVFPKFRCIKLNEWMERIN